MNRAAHAKLWTIGGTVVVLAGLWLAQRGFHAGVDLPGREVSSQQVASQQVSSREVTSQRVSSEPTLCKESGSSESGSVVEQGDVVAGAESVVRSVWTDTASGAEVVELCSWRFPWSRQEVLPQPMAVSSGETVPGSARTPFSLPHNPSIGTPCQACPSDSVFGSIDLAGPARSPAAGRYRIRAGDQLQFTFQQTRERISGEYRLSYGDLIRITSDTHPELTTTEAIEVMPDGTVSIPGVQRAEVAGLTLPEAKAVIEDELVRVGKYNNPRVTLLPFQVYRKLQDLLDAVDSRFGNGGQGITLTVVRDGTVALPGIGTICVIGLTKEELMDEINARFDQVIEGIFVTVNIGSTAPAFVYVVGQVNNPGRLEARLPMTLLQAIAQAGGHTPGANMRRVIVVRRRPDWQMEATTRNLNFSNRARPTHLEDLWLWDSDLVIVPKDDIQRIDELIDLYLTRGAYSILPPQVQFDSNSIF